MSNLTREFTKYGDPFIFEHTAITKADIAVVFGNQYLVDELAYTAALGYHLGLYPKIIASGGNVANLKGRPIEALAIKVELEKWGVPRNKILIDDQSLNTGENVQNSKALVEEEVSKGQMYPVKTVFAIGNAVAGPRFMMTILKQWPGVLPMQVSVFNEGLNLKNCYDDERFSVNVRSEKVKLDIYDGVFVEQIRMHVHSEALSKHANENGLWSSPSSVPKTKELKL